MRALAQAVLVVAELSASPAARADVAGPVVQESDPNVGLFRLPAHRGEGDALAGPEGFGVLSTDNGYGLMLHPLLQVDGRDQLADDGDPHASSFLVRFAGLAVNARFFEHFRAELLVGFSTTKSELVEGWVDGEVASWLHFKAGTFKFPISFERSTAGLFYALADASLTSGLLPASDTGLELWGKLDRWLEYTVAVVNGATAGQVADTDPDRSKDAVARVIARPFVYTSVPALQHLSAGIGMSAGEHDGRASSPELARLATWSGRVYFAFRPMTAQAQAAVATGTTLRVVPQASWYLGPISAYAEYARTSDVVDGATVNATAESAVVTAILTGESASPLHYVVPSHPFDLSQSAVGAVEVAVGIGRLRVQDDGRLGQLVDPNSAMRGAQSLSVGLNWYPVVNLRAMVDFERTEFLAVRTFATFAPENLVLLRLQLIL